MFEFRVSLFVRSPEKFLELGGLGFALDVFEETCRRLQSLLVLAKTAQAGNNAFKCSEEQVRVFSFNLHRNSLIGESDVVNFLVSGVGAGLKPLNNLFGFANLFPSFLQGVKGVFNWFHRMSSNICKRVSYFDPGK